MEIAEAIQRQSKELYGKRGPLASSDMTRSACDHSASRQEWFWTCEHKTTKSICNL